MCHAASIQRGPSSHLGPIFFMVSLHCVSFCVCISLSFASFPCHSLVCYYFLSGYNCYFHSGCYYFLSLLLLFPFGLLLLLLLPFAFTLLLLLLMCFLIVLLKLVLPFPLHFASWGLEIGAFLTDKYQDFFYEISFFFHFWLFFSLFPLFVLLIYIYLVPCLIFFYVFIKFFKHQYFTLILKQKHLFAWVICPWPC
jgi:hypothetical protein